MARPRLKASKAPMAPPATLFLFGAFGDLVERLLMPALYNLADAGAMNGYCRANRNPIT